MTSCPSPSSPPQLPLAPCGHFAAYLGPSLRSLRRYLRRTGGFFSSPSAAVLRDPTDLPRCSLCSSSSSTSRFYACLTCAHILCSSHSSNHPHPIAIDIDRAELFCFSCSDQIYHPDLDLSALVTISSSVVQDSILLPDRKRRKKNKSCAADGEENDSMKPTMRMREDLLGLRGLNNLGSTCFMNSVLQALMHAPPLRNFFLGDKHNRHVCRRKAVKLRQNGNENESVRVCLACDLDAVYSAVFSGDRTPYSPAKFLYSWWQHASNLASYEQQDAHEFFISVLDGIHEKVAEDQANPYSSGPGDCCVAHKVFSGILRSDVICTTCGFTSTAYDPCLDISLDLDCNQGSSKVAIPESQVCNGEHDLISSQSTGFSTLRGCLERFTRPERLGSDQKFFCQHCKVRQESLKQMSIRKLPIVTCFHIKRFEHSHVRKMSRKVDSYLQFPFSLDMSAFLASSVLKSRFGNRIVNFDGVGVDSSSEFSSELELFAVITHNGRLDSGHYVTFVRLNDQWYKCDDAWITNISESTVRASQAYMLFYVQKVLYYNASENVTAH